MKQFRESPTLAVKVLADTCYDFGYDCIIIDFDTCTLAEAMGPKLLFPEFGPARVKNYFLKSMENITRLRVPDPEKDGRLPLWIEATKELRKLVDDEKVIKGRADQGPFGLLFQLRQSEEMVDTGCDVLELDHLNNIERSLQKVDGRLSVWGNLDPSSMISFGTPDMIISESKRIFEAAKKFARNRFVLCPGCLVNSDAPAENIQVMTVGFKTNYKLENCGKILKPKPFSETLKIEGEFPGLLIQASGDIGKPETPNVRFMLK